MSTKGFNISVVLTVKSSENIAPQIIKQCIRSIINQSICFNKNVQLIIISNHSNKIYHELFCKCEKTYSNNIIYKRTNETDDSSLQNIGVQLARGKYISLITPDVIFSLRFFQKAFNYIEKNQNEIDFICATIKNEMSKSRFQPNDNYQKNEIIHLDAEYNRIQLWAFSALIKREAVNELAFDENTPSYAQENKFMLQLSLHKKKYGVVNGVFVQVNRPLENNWAQDGAPLYKNWYMDFIKNFSIPLFEETKKNYGQIPEFIQFGIYYLLQWRLLANLNDKFKQALTEEELNHFFVLLQQMLQYIDDSVIVNLKRFSNLLLSTQIRIHLLKLKHQKQKMDYEYEKSDNDVTMAFNGIPITSFSESMVNVELLEYENGTVHLEGNADLPFDLRKCKLFLALTEETGIAAAREKPFEGKKYSIVEAGRYSLTKLFGRPVYRGMTFKVDIPIDKNSGKQHLWFYLQFEDKVVVLELNFTRNHSRLSNVPVNSYWHADDRLFLYNKKSIVILKANITKLLQMEFKILLEMLFTNKRYMRKALILRILFWLSKPFFTGKQIWLAFDKLYKAGDNGEYFMKYAQKQKDGIKKYYIVQKNSYDYPRLKKEKMKIILFRSKKHYLYFLHSHMIFATHANVYSFNAFPATYARFFRGLFKFKVVHIQHGLTVQRFAHTMGKLTDNIKMYFCASKYEIENLSKPVYGYSRDALKLTGIPRYDGLINNDQKQILITPTWRMSLVKPPKMGEKRPYNPEFKNTIYFKVYNELINNRKLIAKAKEKGYKLIYLIHPTLSSQINDYDQNEFVQILPATDNVSYEKLLNESSIMVTDYSGVQFDFAYMRKPVVYLHHKDVPPYYESSCFFYDTMGFGEICKDNDSLINLLCDYLDNECAPKSEYIKRADDFFAFNDHDNCMRIYNEVIDLYNVAK